MHPVTRYAMVLFVMFTGRALAASLDPAAMDRAVDPCEDFYAYACGGWQRQNPIPPEQTSWDVYARLYEENLAALRQTLSDAAMKAEPRTVARQIGDFYTACVDEAAVRRRGARPVREDLAAIAALKRREDLAPLLARLHQFGDNALFGSGSMIDPDDSAAQIAGVSQGGLGLPERDYYIAEDPDSARIRARYRQHVAAEFRLLGDSTRAAGADADAVLRIETALAAVSLTPLEQRDPYRVRNKLKLAELAALAPAFDWPGYFAALGFPPPQIVNLSSLEFFRGLGQQLATASLADWRAYLRFHVVDGRSPYLSPPFADENFAFYRAYLRGAERPQPRWKRCVSWTDQYLGEALSEEYVRRHFDPATRAATREMAGRIEAVMAGRIATLDWMSEATRRQALGKLAAVRNKIGYPERWRDYSGIEIRRDDFYGNVQRAALFEVRRDIAKIGQPVDRDEWAMTPTTVNALYDSQRNDITFPAGVLQPPLFDTSSDAAPNYGDTGSTIGHELTHAFDDRGRQYDAAGNLRDWWTPEDAGRFATRAQCIVDQYGAYTVDGEVHVNSRLTEGEDIADLGGSILAYVAWQEDTRGQALPDRDGLTAAQRFFVGMGQWACENARPEEQRVLARTDPHSPARFRVNGVVANMPEFARAFSCRDAQAMVKPADKVCHIW